jgi:NAD(P)-dependent dehydrogenase (short-subunit alcohol dehydrogenase family)
MSEDEDDVAGEDRSTVKGSTHPTDSVSQPGAGGPETALVVGADSAVGRATALAFREDGWRVYATASQEATVADLADHGCVTDDLTVTDATHARRVVNRVEAEAGRLDCLTFADAAAPFGPIEEVDVGAVEAHLDRTVVGPLRLFQRALSGMREREDGTVVVVSSVLARVGAPGTGVYGASQHAVGALCDAMRAEVADDGVDVSVVEPALLDAALGAPTEPPEETEYEWVYDLLADVQSLGNGAPGVAPPERVGAAVVNAASATMPAPRYPVGAAADVLSKTRYLPDDWRDVLYGLIRRTSGRA